MPFQSEVFLVQGEGVQGDRYSDSPWRAQSFILASATDDLNIIGRTMYTVSSEGVAEAGSGGVNGFAGLLVNSKVYASRGTLAGGPLAPTMVLANDEQAELTTMGSYYAYLPAAAAIGDLVVYDNTSGEISTISPGAPLAVGTSFGFALVDVKTVAAEGLAIITLSPTLVIPV